MRYYAPMINRLPKADNSKRIALSFDDGPNETALPKLLELLDKHHVKANFFFIGQNLERNMNLAKELHQQGHLIGNHSYSHKSSFPISSWAIVRNEIVTTNSLIKEITHKKNAYFRPPFGVSNPIIAKVVKDLNMTMIGWSLRSYDTVKKGDTLFEKLKKNINDRDIVLLHEIEQNFDVIDKFIEYAKQQGFTFVLLSDIEIKS
jgi:peptidoglycan/xylan/chitin deacetylase (PgdA/CDA1 family)